MIFPHAKPIQIPPLEELLDRGRDPACIDQLPLITYWRVEGARRFAEEGCCGFTGLRQPSGFCWHGAARCMCPQIRRDQAWEIFVSDLFEWLDTVEMEQL